MTRKIPFRDGGSALEVVDAVAVVATPERPAVLLADISEWNPDIADAAYLAWSKAIVIRAAYGDQHDDRAWYGGQRRALLHSMGAQFVGIYQYLVAGQDGAAQARAFLSLAGDIRPGEVFIADFEEGQHAMLTAWYDQMLTSYGQDIAPYLWTYTGLDFGKAHGALPVEWIAAYGQPEPATPHKLWQFTSSYDVPGVGSADCSVYWGTISQLAGLAYQAQTAWTYEAPSGLHASGGHTSVALTWHAPPGPVPAYYLVWLYEGTICDEGTLVDSYPRTTPGSPWQGGGLERGRTYTAHVSAFGPDGSHADPGVYASVQFTTG